MKLAKSLGKKTRELGNEIAKNLLRHDNLFRDIKVMGPGFMNFYLKKEALYQEIFNLILNKEFKNIKQDIKSKPIKLCIAMEKLSDIFSLENFRAFMNMYYLGNIYKYIGHKPFIIIVVKERDDSIKTSYFLSNFKDIDITTDKKTLEDSIIFCSAENQWLFNKEEKDHRIITEVVGVYKNGDRINNVNVEGLIDKIGLNRLKYTLCTKPTKGEMIVETTENELEYLQYPYSRISSIIDIFRQEGLDINMVDECDFDILDDELEKEMVIKLSEFKDEVKATLDFNEPYRLIRYAQELCNTFYNLDRSTLFRKLQRRKLISLLKLLSYVKIVIEEIHVILEVPIYEKM